MLISKELAEKEVKNIADFFEIELPQEDWEKLVSAAEKGRLQIDTANGIIKMTLIKPIIVDGGESVKQLDFSEPTAGAMRLLDKHGDKDKMTKAIHLTSLMTGQPVGVIDKMGSRDLNLLGAIIGIFF